MSTPLTDAINALTTYANSVTGASDTNLTDAVHTLADGYGQGGGAENVTLTIVDNFGASNGIHIPPNATWTGFEPDMDTGEVKGVLTIPQNSMFVLVLTGNNRIVSSVITSEEIQIAGSGETIRRHAYSCYVGTSSGRVSVEI